MAAFPACALTVHQQGKAETIRFVRGRIVLGRAPECDVMLPLPDVSRVHAAIEYSAGTWRVSDLNSRYGTKVNDRPIVTHSLADGDRITLGLGRTDNATVVFHLPQDNQAESVCFDEHSEAVIQLALNAQHYEQTSRAADATMGETLAGVEENRFLVAGVPLVGLFKQLAEALLSGEQLEEILPRILDSAMEVLPAERGSICLCDPATQEIQAVASRSNRGLEVGEIRISRTIAREVIRNRRALLVDDVAADSRFAAAQSIVSEHIHSAVCAPLYHAGRVEGLIYLDTRQSAHRFTQADLELLTVIGILAAVGIVQVRLRDEARRQRELCDRLSRYSSPHVVEQIAATAREGQMLAAECQVSVLFADLCDFTSMVDGVEPAQVAGVLNTVFDHLTRAVFLYEGTLDKYLGDGLLAVFGAPLPQHDHAERAIQAALLMQRILTEQRIAGPRGQPVRMRVGINSGKAVAGDIGSPIRKDYTVIGDAINVASRLESSVARPGQIVVGPTTYQMCSEQFRFQRLPAVQLKGKQERIEPYLVVGPRGQESHPRHTAPHHAES